MKLFTPDLEFEYLQAKPKLENANQRKGELKTKPAYIIMIIGNRRIPLSLESAQYAWYNKDLYAQYISRIGLCAPTFATTQTRTP